MSLFYRTNNSRFVLILLCVMVHSGIAYAPELVAYDILDSTAFNVAMFAMGWAATKWASALTGKGKSNEPLGLLWMKAMATVPLALRPPRSPCSPASPAADIVEDDCAMTEQLGETPLLAAEDEGAEALLSGMSALLSQRIASVDTSELPPWHRKSVFYSKQTSPAQLYEYLAHIHWFFECSSPCLVIAMMYLDRIISRGAKLTFCAETSHRLVLTSLVAAVKFHDDDWKPYPNSFYASIGEVGVEEMNAMEKQFCKSIDWHFYVGPEEYLQYRDLITAAAPTTAATM
jgi:hypothetical protein